MLISVSRGMLDIVIVTTVEAVVGENTGVGRVPAAGEYATV